MELIEHITTGMEYERLFRSQIIADAADAEASVDRLIAWHFCPDRARHGLFFHLLFREGEIGLSKKLRISGRLLRDFYPDLAKTAAFWIKGLDRLRILRNKLAHGRIEIPTELPPSDQAEGVSIWVLRPTGESVLEFLPRSVVDRQMRHSRHLITAGVCLARLVEDRVLHQLDAERQAVLVDLIAAAEKGIGRDAA